MGTTMSSCEEAAELARRRPSVIRRGEGRLDSRQRPGLRKQSDIIVRMTETGDKNVGFMGFALRAARSRAEVFAQGKARTVDAARHWRFSCTRAARHPLLEPMA
jgi:hypothetical protein